jgi:basic membrane protein A and related proteins
MKKGSFKIFGLVLMAVLTLGLALPTSGLARNIKVALLLSGPANDGGWNAVALKGLKDAEKKYGIETAYTEHVSVADSESAFIEYAAQGYDLIIGHGFQFGEPAVRVGKRFKKTKFAAIESNFSSKNVASFVMSIEQAGYLMGIIVASMTETGVIGMVGGMEVPSIVKYIEAYKIGAKEQRPDIKILESYVGSFTDVAKGKEAAMAMIDQNADVISHIANQAGTGAIKAAQAKGLMATGDSWDQNVIAPNTIICSALYHVPVLVMNMVELVKNGKFKGGIYYQGMEDGVVALSPYHSFENKVPASVKRKVASLTKQMKNGSFTAPLIWKRTRN